MMRWGTWALWLMPSLAMAGVPVILVQDKVAQYREAGIAAKHHLPNAVEVDPAASDVAERLKDASVVVAVGQKALTEVRKTGGSAPVVFCMVLGATKATLGERVSGVPLEPDPASTFTQMRAVDQAVRRVGVIYDPKASELVWAEAQRVASASGITLVGKAVSQATEVRDAMGALGNNVDAYWIPPNPQLIGKELFAFMLGFSAERKVPLFGFLESFTEAGALASISPDYGAIGDRAGRLAAELARSSKGLGQVTFAPGKLSINLKTAQALGVEVSAKAQIGAKLFH